jgi:hypothetical protein
MASPTQERSLLSFVPRATPVIRAAAYVFERGRKLTRRSRCAYCGGAFPPREPHSFCFKWPGFGKMGTVGWWEHPPSDQRTYTVWRSRARLRIIRTLEIPGLLLSPIGLQPWLEPRPVPRFRVDDPGGDYPSS